MTKTHCIDDYFDKNNEEYLEQFLIIFDRAKNERMALENAAEYYQFLMEENISVDIDKIIEAAEDFGYDISNLENMTL